MFETASQGESLTKPRLVTALGFTDVHRVDLRQSSSLGYHIGASFVNATAGIMA